MAVPPAPVRPPPSERKRAQLTRRAQLRYSINGRPFSLPIVTGTIGGRPASLLVDTGTNSHVIAAWYARKIGLAMNGAGDVGSDSRGKEIETLRIDDVELSIDGWGPLARVPVFASEVPDIIERLGIGGFISPQRLVEEGDAVLLDLAKGELRSAWWEDAQRELSATGVPLLVGGHGRTCEGNAGPIKGLAFVIPGAVESQRVDFLLGTGSQHSDIFATSSAGRLLASRSVEGGASYTASGRAVRRVIKGARVDVGSFSQSVDIDLTAGAADTSCARDGLVAMDVLRSCALLLGRSRLIGRCGLTEATGAAGAAGAAGAR